MKFKNLKTNGIRLIQYVNKNNRIILKQLENDLISPTKYVQIYQE